MARLSRREWLYVTTALVSTSAMPGNAIASGAEEEGMILIPAGPCFLGTTSSAVQSLAAAHGYHASWLDGETPEREVELPGYYIDRFPVTNAQYGEFCRSTGYPPRSHWGSATPPEPLLEHPVVCVDRADAVAYAKWVGKRIPLEAEWEKAARGPTGLMFPWGDTFDPHRCQWDRGGDPERLTTAPVDAYPGGASPYGVMDMVGNAAEWCADGPGRSAAYIKGGCYLTASPINLRPASRIMSGFDNNASVFYGFRCVKESR